MDIRTLPEQEREIYNKLRQKYSLTFDSLKIGEKNLRLLKVADLEQFLEGKDPFADVTEFPFWVKLWDAAMILAYTIGGMDRGAGKRLLELGAGLGAPGLAAAANGFEVTISDYEELILDFQRVSIAASGLNNVNTTLLDWLDPPDLEPFDVLAGAEILFRDEFFEPLLDVFQKYLAPGGTILLAHDARRQSLPKFLAKAEQSFQIAGKAQKIRRDGKEVTIILNRLRRKQ